ncbi:MAG: discoidin domain-containing protein, partial [Negativicutes bacterium]|nr:discoidin domain-containing protein [Negativicutes bacterium]
SDISLASFWKNIELTAWGTNIVPQTTGWPFSRGKPATQSSVCEWSFAPAVERDASGAVNGKIDGTRKFHTGFETNPWWQVDLENTATIRRIKIFNTTDETASRFKDFSLAVSIDGDIWAEITRKEDGITVGNLNTAPYIWEGQTPAWGRYVRITALGENICMHLDQVEVYADNVKPAKQNSGADTTIVITSCNRHDLLEKTLKSLMRYNTYEGVREILVVEDGDADPADICARYGARLIRVGERRGQLHAIDIAYSQVKTPYIFHCEDDWEFYKSGFIEKSLIVLKGDEACVCVWLRAWDDTNGHPLSFQSPDKIFGVLSFDYLGTWHGFSWNPGLRRKSDYERVGPFSHVLNHHGDLGEPMVSTLYRDLGYHAVILDETGYVRHIGGDRHVSP